METENTVLGYKSRILQFYNHFERDLGIFSKNITYRACQETSANCQRSNFYAAVNQPWILVRFTPCGVGPPQNECAHCMWILIPLSGKSCSFCKRQVILINLLILCFIFRQTTFIVDQCTFQNVFSLVFQAKKTQKCRFRLEKGVKILFDNRNETFRSDFYIGSMLHFASKFVQMNTVFNFQNVFSLLFSVETLKNFFKIQFQVTTSGQKHHVIIEMKVSEVIYILILCSILAPKCIQMSLLSKTHFSLLFWAKKLKKNTVLGYKKRSKI